MSHRSESWNECRFFSEYIDARDCEHLDTGPDEPFEPGDVDAEDDEDSGGDSEVWNPTGCPCPAWTCAC